MKHIFAAAVIAAFSLTMAVPAGAVAISYAAYGSSQLDFVKGLRAISESGLGPASVLEDFESFVAVPLGNTDPTVTGQTPLLSSIGTFTTVNGAICGGSCDTPEDQSLIRDASDFGRFNTTTDGANWLDSNDNSQIMLSVDAGLQMSYISFFVTDADDVGLNAFSIEVDGVVENIGSAFRDIRPDGNIFLILINFEGAAPTTSTIKLTIDDGDGFGIDDIAVYGSIAPVPLPASAALLMGAVAGLGLMRRRKSA